MAEQAMTDAIGRLALARTIIIGNEFEIELGPSNPDPQEISISLYHEVLEAAAVATELPPECVVEMNEEGFESAARSYHLKLGMADPQKLNQMLEDFGF